VLDYLALMVGIGLIVGGVLGWYVPKAARNRHYRDASVKNAWQVAIEKNAQKLLGSPKAVSFWLQSPISEFNNQTPKSAIIDRKTFEVGLKELQKRVFDTGKV
jgi:hypothetical protein